MRLRALLLSLCLCGYTLVTVAESRTIEVNLEAKVARVTISPGHEVGEPLRPLAWKDTVDVPYKKTVRLAVRYDDRPGATGMWMFHCHILDHAEGGLMGMVELGAHHHHMSDP